MAKSQDALAYLHREIDIIYDDSEERARKHYQLDQTCLAARARCADALDELRQAIINALPKWMINWLDGR